MKYLCLKFAFAATLLLLFVNPAIAQEITREQYINTYKDIAIRQMKLYGIPASIILAQGCLESGNGNSRLAVKGNNHFGIKCHNTWKGRRIYHNDDEKGECFRRYTQAEDSFKDHSEFLRNGKRYQSLFDLSKTDYKAWAHGLKAAGYATNPKYAQLLIDIIERDQLYRYDTNTASQKVSSTDKKAEKERKRAMKQEQKAEKARKKEERRAARDARRALRGGTPVVVAAAAPVAVVPATTTETVQFPDKTDATPKGAVVEEIESMSPLKSSNLYRYSMDRQIYQENGVPFIIATAGDTYQGIAKDYNLFTAELLSFNDLKKEAPIVTGTMIYIKRKKKLGSEGAYTVLEGETMYVISQKKGIRLESLYDLNQMKYGAEPEAGKILNLKK